MNRIFEENEKTKAVLVGVCPDNDLSDEVNISLDELALLLDTAGGEVFCRLIQNKPTPDSRTYIGSGKVKELKELCEANGVPLVIFDDELTPSQIKGLETDLSSKEHEVTVIDRTMLILDIFALHATTAAGKMQVELAQLRYTIPRLSGRGTELSRLGGGIGTRGPGETKLESDRRHLKRRIAALEEELEKLDRVNKTKRKQRDRNGIPRFAIAGYTNAGKSTLLNRLTDAGILAENKLFATLDPTTRSYTLPNGSDILLTDTVGFIRNLPHHLVKAFQSTLDEVVYCDALLLVIDACDPNADTQREVTEKLLEELGAGDKPILYVYNKCDLLTAPLPQGRERTVCVSAKTGLGLDTLIAAIEALTEESKRITLFSIPMSESRLLNTIYRDGNVLETEYEENAVRLRVLADRVLRGRLAEYIVEDKP
ncbi:MAG: GTPase HflX [Ruminococcaceae bacterium]|nr:GTPase HflX [Oscillospiraceae bacterium]